MFIKKHLIVIIVLILSLIMLYISKKNKNREIYKYLLYNDGFERNTYIPVSGFDITEIDDDDENDEFTEKMYNFEKTITKRISKLRWFETEVINNNTEINQKNYLENIRMINSIYYQTFNKLNSIVYMKQILDELSDRNTFYYRYMNEHKLHNMKFNGKNIDVFRISKHHHAVEWVFKNIKDEIGTILHVDSHADMNQIPNDVQFFTRCIDNGDFTFSNLKRIYDSVQDIGSVLVPMVAPYRKNNGIIWLTPDWVKEPFCKSINKITTSYDYCRFVGKCPVNFPNNKMDFLKKLNNSEDKTIQMMTSNIKYSKKLIDEITDDYILNIDLDYFVTWGNDNYLPDGCDAISDNRTVFDHGYILKTDIKRVWKVEVQLQRELCIIRKRLDKFLIFIKTLKEYGKIPKLIIICDSTRVDFTNDELGQEFITLNETELVNEYTPKYLAFWLHNTMLRHLKLLFNE